jgi:hypothetical protein
MSWLHLDERSAIVVAGILAMIALFASRRGGRVARWVAAAAYESGLVCALFALWQLANTIAHGHRPGGLAHGRWVWHLERVLHVPSETSFQQLVLGHGWLVRSANYYYATAHLTGMVVFLGWLWLRHRDRYRHWRNVVVAFTAVALLIEAIPVAPPRLIGGTGLVDTATVYGQSVYAAFGDLADQYAALPSIHAGWALLIALAMLRCGGRLAGAIGVTHAALTVAVIVVTANHYWFDAFTAAAVLALAVAAVGTFERLDPAGRALHVLVPFRRIVARVQPHPVVPLLVGDDLAGEHRVEVAEVPHDGGEVDARNRPAERAPSHVSRTTPEHHPDRHRDGQDHERHGGQQVEQEHGAVAVGSG